MWRSIIIYNGERISTEDNWLVVTKEEGKPVRIPMEDLYCVLIDNQSLVITMPVFMQLAKFGVHLIVCDEKHLPVSQTFPMNTNYHCFRIMKKQIEMLSDFKGEVWKRITQAKISNQATVLDNLYVNKEIVVRMHELSDEVSCHDMGNREGIAAKMFFRNLYGASFIRFEDNIINSVMNYGYAIIRSGVAKSLSVHGFNCVIGIHHISETNEFNLADDFMEPLRPIVDEWVAKNLDFIEEGLNKDVKAELVNLVNQEIIFNGKTTKVRYAIDQMVKSFITAIELNNPNRLELPKIILHHEK